MQADDFNYFSMLPALFFWERLMLIFDFRNMDVIYFFRSPNVPKKALGIFQIYMNHIFWRNQSHFKPN